MLDAAAVQHAVRLLFTTLARTGSARATAKALDADGLAFSARPRPGLGKGTPTWLPLRHHRVLQVLRKPRYGARAPPCG